MTLSSKFINQVKKEKVMKTIILEILVATAFGIMFGILFAWGM